MIIYVESQHKRKHYVINRPEDFEELFRDYPRLRDLTLYDEDLADAADTVIDYLSNHHLDAWVEGDELNKGLKEKAAALGMAATMTLGPQGLATQDRATASVPTSAQIQTVRPQFGQHPHDPFLWTIQQIESSGGKNLKHQEIQAGPQKGQTAIGRWGMLKPTIEEFLRREKTKRGGQLPSHLEKLQGKSRDQLGDHFEANPDDELELARMIGAHVMRRHGGNEHKAAYSWLHGHNLMSGDVSPEMVSGSQYVNKYKSLRPTAPFTPPVPKKLTKTQKIKKTEKKHVGFAERLKVWAQRAIDRESTVTPSDPGGNLRPKTEVPDPKTQPERIKAVLAAKRKYIDKDSKPNLD